MIHPSTKNDMPPKTTNTKWCKREKLKRKSRLVVVVGVVVVVVRIEQNDDFARACTAPSLHGGLFRRRLHCWGNPVHRQINTKLDHVVPVGRQHRQIWRLVAETEDVGPRVPHQPPFVLVATCC